ncbi:hypothetical protein HKBW3S03_00877, partial [Candidatus Hakubella thermalkaliphila]
SVISSKLDKWFLGMIQVSNTLISQIMNGKNRGHPLVSLLFLWQLVYQVDDESRMSVITVNDLRLKINFLQHSNHSQSKKGKTKSVVFVAVNIFQRKGSLFGNSPSLLGTSSLT